MLSVEGEVSWHRCKYLPDLAPVSGGVLLHTGKTEENQNDEDSFHGNADREDLKKG